MYHSFFKFKCEPFGVSPDPRFFFPSESHAEAAASLWYAINQCRGFASLIASPGLGKTTLVVTLTERLRHAADVVFLVNPRLNADTLLESILVNLGVVPDAQSANRTGQLAMHLLALHARGRTCVVILDEAQNLGGDALETVRLLSNFEAPSHKLIQFIFIGQPALATLLRRPECEQIRQRINVVARLNPLGATEVESYILHRVTIAGGKEMPFTPAAVKAISDAAQGVPRIINTICFSALTLAFARSSRMVTEADVAEALSDLSLDAFEIPAPVESAGAQPCRLPVPVFATGQRELPASIAAAVLLLIIVAGLFAWATVSDRAAYQSYATATESKRGGSSL